MKKIFWAVPNSSHPQFLSVTTWPNTYKDTPHLIISVLEGLRYFLKAYERLDLIFVSIRIENQLSDVIDPVFEIKKRFKCEKSDKTYVIM